MANCRFVSPPWYDPIAEIRRGRGKRARFAAAPGPPLAPLNFRLCLCGSGELLQVRSRPAGSLCHQWKWFFALRLKRSVGGPFVLPFRAKIRSQVASDSHHGDAANGRRRRDRQRDKGGDFNVCSESVKNNRRCFQNTPPPVPLKQKWPPLKSSGDTGSAVMPVS